MGSDIHFFVEVMRPSGRWEHVKSTDPCVDCSGLSVPFPVSGMEKPTETYCYTCLGTHRGEFYTEGRNYWLFGVLAGVRGSGPAIRLPRGLPSDLSEAVKGAYDSLGGDAHTPSWLTVEQLDAWPAWRQHCDTPVFVTMQGWLELRATGAPRESFSHLPAMGHLIVDADKMNKLVHGLWEPPIGVSAITKVTYKRSNASRAPKFVNHTMPALRALGAPDCVRIVFFFDS